MTSTLSIGFASSENVLEALRLVFRDLDPDNREPYVQLLEENIRQGSLSAEGLIEARREGALVGAILHQRQPGNAAVIWPPRIVAGEPTATATQLLNAASELATREGLRVAQVLLGSNAEPDDAVLRAGAYRPLAELIYLVSEEEAFPSRPPAAALEFEASCPVNQVRLVRTLEATYEGTLDCPQLNGVRTNEEVLEGYRETGVFDPARWLIARHQEHDVGCLLLADHPEDSSWELVYMGLIPSARGRGWGLEIARHAQWLTKQAGRPRLTVGVDAANVPAIRMYHAAGFREWERRIVYLKILRA